MEASVEQKPHRVYSVFFYTGWVTVVLAFSAIVIWAFRFAGPLAPLAALPLSVGAGMSVIGLPMAIITGIFCPIRSSKRIPMKNFVFAGVSGGIGMFILAMEISLVVSGLNMIKASSKGVSGVYANIAELHKERIANVVRVDDMIPPMATDIHYKGQGGVGLLALGWGCQFSCKVSEADFLAFAADKNYQLSTNIFRNANTKIVDGDRYPAEMDISQIGGWLFVPGDEQRGIKNYLGYWYGYSNCGGIILAYDLDTGILYGSYSSN